MSEPETTRIDVPAHAKLNLGLRLMGRRADGLHLLESIFAPIELCDDVRVELVPGPHQIELRVSEAEEGGLPAELGGVTAGPDNLAFRGAAAFCEAYPLDRGIRIRLVKRIPAAAGMGGGSSDAAAVLRGLSVLAGEPLSDAQLAQIAVSLGADVPFFLQPQLAYVSGIGEVIAPLDAGPRGALLVANAGVALNTGAVFRTADALGSALTEPRAGSTMRAFLRLCREIEDPGEDSAAIRAAWSDLLVNDLEPAACQLCPPIGSLLDSIRAAGALGAAMTGSGATVFGVFDSEASAEAAAEGLRTSSSLRPSGRGGAESAEGAVWARVSRFG